MGYVTPGTVAAGDVATAAAWNVITNDILQFAPFVQGVFTTEAVRDAAITSPTEGMHAYITASTIAAATGATTAVPTGIQTIYNGAAWVCITPIGAATIADGATTSTAFSATLTGSPGTNPSVTLSTGTTVLLSLSSNTYGNATLTGYISCAVSGASTRAGSTEDLEMYLPATSVGNSYQSSFILTGLTAGTNTFTLQYANGNSGQTVNFRRRRIVVTGIA